MAAQCSEAACEPSVIEARANVFELAAAPYQIRFAYIMVHREAFTMIMGQEDNAIDIVHCGSERFQDKHQDEYVAGSIENKKTAFQGRRRD